MPPSITPTGARPGSAADNRPRTPAPVHGPATGIGPKNPAPPVTPHPAPPPAPQAQAPARPKRRRRRHPVRRLFTVVLVVLLGGAAAFLLWANSTITHVEALSGAANTPGRTTLIVGSDSREGWGDDGTEGARTDTIMVLHKPTSGPVALISIPRDSYVKIPGYGSNKINAAFAFGGAPLLVDTVEELTGLTVDLYLEVGFTGVASMVDAVGGVELCYPDDVNDKKSKLTWKAGCHQADGETALAFSRMRYSDPLGDIGRTQRQRQVVGAVAKEALSPATLINPVRLLSVTSAGLESFAVSEGSGIFSLGRAALDLRAGLGNKAVTGTPPISDMGYRVDGVGSTVRLDPDQIDEFWQKIARGAYPPGEQVGGVG